MDIQERQAQQRQSILEVLREDLEEHVNQSIDSAAEEPDTESVRQALAAATDNFAGACEVIGLTGLARYCLWIHRQLDSGPQDPEIIALAGAWAMPALNYIQALLDGDSLKDASDELIAYLDDEFWAAATPPDWQALRQALEEPVIQTEEEADDEWPDTAEPGMLSIALPDNVNHSLLEGFLTELPEQLEQMTLLVEQASGQPAELALEPLHRIAHTVKGSANVVGISGMANLMHLCEDLLDDLQAGRLEPDHTVVGLLSECTDTLGSLLDHLGDGTQPGESECQTLQKLLDVRRGLPIETSPPPAVTPTPAPVDDQTPAAGAAAPATAAETVRLDPQTIQRGLDITGELAIGHTMAQRYTRDNLDTVHQARGLSENLYALTRDFARLLGSGQLSGLGTHSDGPLDRLEFEQYNEFHSLYSRLEELQRDVGDHLDLIQTASLAQREAAQRHSGLLRDLQTNLQQMLGVPFNRLTSRLQRCVRQTARMTDKTVELTLRGDDTLVDSHLLQQLTDPLMHLLRNAVDHGIEPAGERTDTGKPEAGHITVSLSRDEHQLQIELRDDGRGLDRDKILQTARQRGLMAHDESDLTAENLILMPGFSTREHASQTSGRGVGLDVVADAVRQLGGQLRIDSQTGEGCRFTLALPLNLVTDHHLVVRLAGQDLALNTQCIEQLVFHEATDKLPARGEPLYTELLQEALPAFDLADLLGKPQHQDPAQQAHALLLVNTGRERFLVRTPSVSASRELVVKREPPHAPTLTGIHSYTVLADGRVAPIVHLEPLIDAARSGQSPSATAAESIRGEQAQRPARVLIVDDSLSARRSLAQFVEDMGLQADTAKDGLEAVAQLQQSVPAMVLVDMEMPRMNGLELTEHIRANSATRTLAVVMVTSRSTQKHRELAEQAGVDRYLNKPYSDDELTNAIRNGLDEQDEWKNTA